MPVMLHHLLELQQRRAPDSPAVYHGSQQWSYQDLFHKVQKVAQGFLDSGLEPGNRVAIYLPKQIETVISFFAASMAGLVFVPINPLLKPAQVRHIVQDCNARLLLTSPERWQLLQQSLSDCGDMKAVVLVGDPDISTHNTPPIITWDSLLSAASAQTRGGLDSNLAAILYTSGSTGQPKGVVLSHRNMLAGADSVASYLSNSAEDRLLAVLPFSFDYGLSQLTTAFSVGASVVLMDYLFPQDVIRALERYKITGLAAVPPLWNQLVQLQWPESVSGSLRYITNSGGAMPQSTTLKLQALLPQTDIFLMYGLTEAFRSTYLPPDQVSIRPTSMGKAIPNVDILVVREDGSECAPNETGELVHRGPLVSLGYWNAPDKTAERFKPVPNQPQELPFAEVAVWSGDQVYRDEEGYLYFVGRKDEMIKTSGYRVSPTEVEECLHQSGLIKEVAAIGVPHPQLGQAIVLVASGPSDKNAISQHCRQQLPNFMQPQEIVLMEALPRNPNGKLDRKSLSQSFQELFAARESSPADQDSQTSPAETSSAGDNV